MQATARHCANAAVQEANRASISAREARDREARLRDHEAAAQSMGSEVCYRRLCLLNCTNLWVQEGCTSIGFYIRPKVYLLSARTHCFVKPVVL